MAENQKQYLYKRGVNPELDKEFAAAARCYKLRQGETALFWKNGLHWYSIPYSRVQRIFRRVEDVYGRLCCGGRNFRIERMVLILHDGTELDLYIGDDVGKQAEALLQSLKVSQPGILYGKA